MWRATGILLLAPIFVSLSVAQKCNMVTDRNCKPYTNYSVVPDTSGSRTNAMFSLLNNVNCGEEMRSFLCTAMYPSCDFPPKMPCRSVCLKQKTICGPRLKALGIEWPFNCTMFQDSNDNNVCMLADGPGSTQPPLPTPIQTMDILEGKKLRLTCRKAAGKSVKWYYNDRQLQKTKRIKIKKNVLKINKIQTSDAGLYECKDSNGQVVDITYQVIVAAKTNAPVKIDMGSSHGQQGSRDAISSNLTALWGYVKKMEQDFGEGGVHLYMNGAKARRKGNTIDINLNVKGADCDESMGDDDEERYATCLVTPNMPMAKMFKASHRVVGQIRLAQKGRKAPVEMDIHLSGFDVSGPSPQHEHGFHIHEYGGMENGCQTLGGHFNPEKVNHGAPDAKERHHGDLGNIHCDNFGNSAEEITDHKITMFGRNSIIGRSFTIHEGSDDMGLGGTKASLSGGNAGTRIACCTIALSAKPSGP
uniref:CuZn superoxide dismutase n=1 Tax=Pinctada imbricata TaxID=66713 RepID=A0A0D5CB20_PINIB|nr:CuZn superoxide dismutase [Pinctada imbricata]